MAVKGTSVWEMQSDYESLSGVAEELNIRFAAVIKTSGRLCVWLEGPLGAGKTTLCGELLHAMGLSHLIPVTSPTYAYLNEYEIKGKIWAHMDLYRLPEGSGLEELGVEPDHDFTGMLVEWPDKISDQSLIKPDFILEVCREEDPQLRTYRLYRL